MFDVPNNILQRNSGFRTHGTMRFACRRLNQMIGWEPPPSLYLRCRTCIGQRYHPIDRILRYNPCLALHEPLCVVSDAIPPFDWLYCSPACWFYAQEALCKPDFHQTTLLQPGESKMLTDASKATSRFKMLPVPPVMLLESLIAHCLPSSSHTKHYHNF